MNIGTSSKEKNIFEIMSSRRSIRRYKQKTIPLELIKSFIAVARLAPSAANLQPLEYCLVIDQKLRFQLFKTLSWAGYIKPSWTPNENERPMAYIVIMVTDPTNPWYKRDVGLASENILLAAESVNIGSCILCKIDKNQIRSILHIPDQIEIDSVIALGYKAEISMVEELTNSVQYWRDEKNIMHVPKRKLEDIIHIDGY